MIPITPVILSTPGRQCDSLRTSLFDVFGKLLMFEDSLREGAAVGTRNAIRSAVQKAPEQHILFCEDDVEMHPSFKQVIHHFEFPENVGVVSFCDMREMPEGHEAGVFTRSAMGCDQNGWWGNQAMLIHHETAEMLAAADWFDIWLEESSPLQAHRALYHDHGFNCSDVRMAMLVHELGAPRDCYAVHVPSLFRHVGHQSKCFPGRLPELGERETKNWVGNHWTARPMEPDWLARNAAAERNNPFRADFGT